MKTHMERKYPILKDIGSQFEVSSHHEYVFLYDDGAVFRAFACDGVKVSKKIVSAYIYDDWKVPKDLVIIPWETKWRFLHKNVLEFVTGNDMEVNDLTNVRQKRDIQRETIKDLRLKEDEEDPDQKVPHEYEKGYNPKLYP